MRIDDIDRKILAILRRNGRATNKDIAAEVGIPASTCLLRVRRLVETRIVRGFHADIDSGMLGRPMQAMLSVQLKVHTRAENDRFLKKMLGLPGVISVALMAGDDDYLVHIAAASPAALSDFVLDCVTSDPAVAGTHTRLVFKHVPAAGDWMS
ncbi:MAG: Lrp/AsnC family transcriptional regulator [Microbacterium sp.]|uniref:Lrp/AsnC family transcriptional regulator n=1 Tax=Microbacterium sp. TaxID=51671 RepID=UPI0039E55107